MEVKFAVSTDSTCDLTKEELAALDVSVGRLNYTMTGKDGNTVELLDDFDTPEEYTAFFRSLSDGVVARTSILNLDAHVALFRSMAERGIRHALHISQSQGLSPTIDNALAAIEIVKKDFPDIEYIATESRTTTVGEGILVRIACEWRDAGRTCAETRAHIDKIKHNLQHFIVADDLMYLHRGGRLGAVSAVVGTAVRVKPVIVITPEGKLEVWRKELGLKKALARVVKAFGEFGAAKEEFRCVVVHTDNLPVAEKLAAKIEEDYGVKPEIRIMGPIVGAHVGPGAVALCYLSEKPRPAVEKK